MKRYDDLDFFVISSAKCGSTLIMAVLTLGLTSTIFGQSSSLYVTDPARPRQTGQINGLKSNVQVQNGAVTHIPGDPRARPIRSLSLAAVPPPEPRTYQVNDLITIIVREQTTTDIDSDLETEKESGFEGEIADFPRLTLSDLVDFQLSPGSQSDGAPRVDVDFNNKYEGEGQYSRRTEMSARLTARVIDVKPNGLLVLESRKFIENDEETMSLIVTGTCEVESVSADNTVISSDLYDVHISKQNSGELRNSSKKGVLTKVMEFIFNF